MLIIFVVDISVLKGIEKTLPPIFFTKPLPTISSSSQSPPLIRKSGFNLSISLIGVLSLNDVIKSIAIKLDNIYILSSNLFIGLLAPLFNDLTDSSEFRATNNVLPSFFASFKYSICPR